MIKPKRLNWTIGVVMILFVLSLNEPKEPTPQTVLPECFSQADCWTPVKEGYCNVRYDCVAAMCYSEDIPCPEDCNILGDEDNDGLSDCADPDCWNHVACPCERATFGTCKSGQCYCKTGTSSKWLVGEDGGWCACA